MVDSMINHKIWQYKEKLRIKHHLLGAKYQYDSNTKADSPSEIQSKRQSISSHLDQYIKRGKYPKNTELDYSAPAIRDKNGTLCAMAYLIDKTEDQGLVDELDSEGRHKYIREFQSEDLAPWLTKHDMTVDEAARIQPMYSPVNPVLSYALNPVYFVVLIMQIMVLFAGIGIYWLKFRSMDWQISIEQDFYLPSFILNFVGMLFLFGSFIFPLFMDSLSGPYELYQSIFFLSPEFSTLVLPFVLLIATSIYYGSGMVGKYYHPVINLLLVLSSLIYLFSMIAYNMSDVLERGSNLIRGWVDPTPSVGFIFYISHTVTLTVSAAYSIFKFMYQGMPSQ